MRRRTPLAVTVVGALLIGGATTGTTYAQWRNQAAMPSSSVTSGSMGIAVEMKAAVPPATPTLTAGGPAVVIEGTIRDTSSAGARNLRQEISVTGVVLRDPTNLLRLSDLRVAVTPKPPSGCASDFEGAIAGQDTLLGRTAAGGPDASLDVCVTVVAREGAPSSTGTLRLAFLGKQVRPDGAQAGWRVSTDASIDVAVANTTPSLIACAGRKDGNKRFATVSWVASPGVTYTVHKRGDDTGAPLSIVNGIEFSQGSLPNDLELVVKGSTDSGATVSSRYFDIKFPNATCVVKP